MTWGAIHVSQAKRAAPSAPPSAPLALSASGRARMVNGRAAASKEQRIDFSAEIAWFGNMLGFGDILNMDGPFHEIGPRSVFANSVVIRSIFSACNALGQDGLPTLGMVQVRVTAIPEAAIHGSSGFSRFRYRLDAGFRRGETIECLKRQDGRKSTSMIHPGTAVIERCLICHDSQTTILMNP